MANNDDDTTTTINVKSVRKPAWEAARRSAAKQDEPMGSWLSRACETLANLEAGPREFPPGGLANPGQEMANPTAMTQDQLSARILAVAALMQGFAAVRNATGRAPGRRALVVAMRAIEQRQIAVDGLPDLARHRLIAGKAGGKEVPEFGQSETKARVAPGG